MDFDKFDLRLLKVFKRFQDKCAVQKKKRNLKEIYLGTKLD